MKKCLILFIVVLATSFGCRKENDYVVLDVNSSQVQQSRLKSSVVWDNLTQSQKDDQIINTANLDNGKNVGIQCKPWVQKVVALASSNHVAVPTTKTNGYEWNNDPYGHVLGRSTMIENVRRADIVQMYVYTKLYSGPHTAIVVSKDANGINWMDSNWIATNTVGIHYMTFAEFYSVTHSKYTVYHVQ